MFVLLSQALLDCGVLAAFSALLASPVAFLRKRACQAINYIAGGSEAQIQALIDAQVIPPLLAMMREEKVRSVHFHVTWAICNVACGSEQQIRYLAQQDVIPSLCAQFVCANTLNGALDAVKSILRVGAADTNKRNDGSSTVYAEQVEQCGGLDSLLALRSKADISADCRRKAGEILDSHWKAMGRGK